MGETTNTCSNCCYWNDGYCNRNRTGGWEGDEFCSRYTRLFTPEVFKARMAEIRKDGYEETMHIDADALMVEVLKQLGYGEGVAIFVEMPKWYS